MVETLEGRVPPLPFMSAWLPFRVLPSGVGVLGTELDLSRSVCAPAKRVTLLLHHGITCGDTEYRSKAEGLYQLKTWVHLGL